TARAMQRELAFPPPARPPCKQQGPDSEPGEHQGDAYRAQGHADLPSPKHRIEQKEAADDGREQHGCRGRMRLVGAGESIRYESILSPGEKKAAGIEQLR